MKINTIFSGDKKGAGFTLIEVLLAISIFLLVMTPILTLEGLLLTQATRHSRALQRLLTAESLMMENRILARYGKNPLNSKKLEYPPATITYQIKDVAGDLKAFKGVRLETVTIESKERNKKRIERLVSFVPAEEKRNE
jgi:prepilin-type N-terminal cleavage/methylation domain-containing protein